MSNKRQFNALQGLLSQFKIHDPNIRRLVEQLNGKSNKAQEQKEIIRRLRIQNKKLIQQVTVLKEKLKSGKEERTKMMNAVAKTKKLNNSLAEALGSCPQCWGDDPECPTCGGKGITGWRPINRRYFNIYVLGCLEHLYWQARK